VTLAEAKFKRGKKHIEYKEMPQKNKHKILLFEKKFSTILLTAPKVVLNTK